MECAGMCRTTYIDTYYMTRRHTAYTYKVNIPGKDFYNHRPTITQIMQSGTFGSHLPTLQIVAALRQYPSASQSQSPLQFSCVHLPPRRSSDPVVEGPLFGSSQMSRSGLQNISLIKVGSRTFNQSIISLTVLSTAQGYLERG